MGQDGDADPGDDGRSVQPGETYDCDACGGSHVVQQSKGLRVAGTTGGLDPTPYVRCPEAGVVRLTGAADGEATAGADESGGERDWP